MVVGLRSGEQGWMRVELSVAPLRQVVLLGVASRWGNRETNGQLLIISVVFVAYVRLLWR
jgi:hypothetical protein